MVLAVMVQTEQLGLLEMVQTAVPVVLQLPVVPEVLDMVVVLSVGIILLVQLVIHLLQEISHFLVEQVEQVASM